MPHRRRRRVEEPPKKLSPVGRTVIIVLGILGGGLLLLVALWLTQVALGVASIALREGDVVFVVGALALMFLAVASVSIAGPNLIKGLPFHLIGTIGVYAFGTAYAPFGRLRLAGAIIYAAAWCWVYLGETVVRFIRSRGASKA